MSPNSVSGSWCERHACGLGVFGSGVGVGPSPGFPCLKRRPFFCVFCVFCGRKSSQKAAAQLRFFRLGGCSRPRPPFHHHDFVSRGVAWLPSFAAGARRLREHQAIRNQPATDIQRPSAPSFRPPPRFPLNPRGFGVSSQSKRRPFYGPEQTKTHGVKPPGRGRAILANIPGHFLEAEKNCEAAHGTLNT